MISSRERKTLRISQGHLAPGMNLVQWQQILSRHGVKLSVQDPWPSVGDSQVDAIFEEIAGIVMAAKEAALRQAQDAAAEVEVIKPLDLYQPIKT